MLALVSVTCYGELLEYGLRFFLYSVFVFKVLHKERIKMKYELHADMQTDTQGEAWGSFLPHGGFPLSVGALTACLALQITRNSVTLPSSWPWSSPWERQCPTHTMVSGLGACGAGDPLAWG